MARAGLCSRREAEAWIAAGRVAVNGAAIASPALNVDARRTASRVDGKPLPQRERTRLFLFHKPRGLVTTSADTARPPDHLRRAAEGHAAGDQRRPARSQHRGPAAAHQRRRARARAGTAGDRLAAALPRARPRQGRRRRGSTGCATASTIDGVRYGAIEATLDREQGANVWLTFAMREGKNREIRNVLGALGLQVNRLIRVSYGPFQLGELPRRRGDGGQDAGAARAARRAPRGACRRGFFRADRGARAERGAARRNPPRHPEAAGEGAASTRRRRREPGWAGRSAIAVPAHPPTALPTARCARGGRGDRGEASASASASTGQKQRPR